MKTKISITLLSVCALIQLSGCSIARYDTGDLSRNPKVPRIELKSVEDARKIFSNVYVSTSDTNDSYSWIASNIKTEIQDIELGDERTFSIKYHRDKLYRAPKVYIPAQFPNGRKYAAILDTGFSGSFYIPSDIVLDNKLPVYLIDPNRIVPGTFSAFSELCHIPELNIGPVRIKDAVAVYEQEQWQLRVFNIPLNKHIIVNLGLKFIKYFDYVMFDNVNEEAVFSKEGAFEPDNTELWSSYSFEIKPDSIPNDRIMVQIPINGQVCGVAFDSGGSKPGLNLNKSHWQAIEKDMDVKELVDSKVTTREGFVWPGKKATVSELTIGEKIIKNADVHIYDEPERLSLLSLGYFQDTVVVLDFVNNLMWIKK